MKRGEGFIIGVKSDDPGNELQKKAKQQENESAKEKSRHP